MHRERKAKTAQAGVQRCIPAPPALSPCPDSYWADTPAHAAATEPCLQEAEQLCTNTEIPITASHIISLVCLFSILTAGLISLLETVLLDYYHLYKKKKARKYSSSTNKAACSKTNLFWNFQQHLQVPKVKTCQFCIEKCSFMASEWFNFIKHKPVQTLFQTCIIWCNSSS